VGDGPDGLSVSKARDEAGDPMLGTTIGDRYLLLDRLFRPRSGPAS